ncbi:methyltransferase [Fusarium bulbicola]|nr:methyltransferase [Fusarium bulbicola]
MLNYDKTKIIPQATLTESPAKVPAKKRSGIVESRDFDDHEPLRKDKTKIHVVRMENNSRHTISSGSCTTDSLRDWTAPITSSILEYRLMNCRPFRQSQTIEYCFQIDDAQLDWTFNLDEFDFIHIRHLYGATDDWKRPYRQAFTHREPPKIEKEEGHISKKRVKLFFECVRETGRQEESMRAAGFTYLFSKSWKLPVGGWPQDKKLKQIGLYDGAFIDHAIDAFAIFPIGEIMGWSKEELRFWSARRERHSRSQVRCLILMFDRMVYGRKPESFPKTA